MLPAAKTEGGEPIIRANLGTSLKWRYDEQLKQWVDPAATQRPHPARGPSNGEGSAQGAAAMPMHTPTKHAPPLTRTPTRQLKPNSARQRYVDVLAMNGRTSPAKSQRPA